jgi:hypothetical protein
MPDRRSADDMLLELAELAPPLAGAITELLDPGAPVDFSKVSAAIPDLSDAQRAAAEQLLEAWAAAAASERCVEIAESISDDDLAELALQVRATSGDVFADVGPDDLALLTVIQWACRALAANADDAPAMRCLLGAGFADVLVGLDRSSVVLDADPLSRQVAVTAAATDIASVVGTVTMTLVEVFSANPTAPVRLNLASIDEVTNRSAAQMFVFYPELISWFDELIASRVPDSPAGLRTPA